MEFRGWKGKSKNQTWDNQDSRGSPQQGSLVGVDQAFSLEWTKSKLISSLRFKSLKKEYDWPSLGPMLRTIEVMGEMLWQNNLKNSFGQNTWFIVPWRLLRYSRGPGSTISKDNSFYSLFKMFKSTIHYLSDLKIFLCLILPLLLMHGVGSWL